MAREIAVFIGENGSTAALEEPGKIVIYRRKLGKWQPASETKFLLDRAGGTTGVRRQLLGMIEVLGECRIFAARTVSGLLYKELEQAGFSIWEFTGRPAEFLEYILLQEEFANRTPLPASTPVQPVIETGPGCYKVSLIEVQQSGNGMTSKQVLQPLLNGKFYHVEVLCSHIPPWLEAEWACGNLDCIAEKTTAGVKLNIKKRNCG